ncbi:MAG: hypothetical protein LBI58_02070 [Tannerellaceae bacterium]|jgi:hypothetical protein|nr:hypothetical protein [Tannerellaceae bacterium]
MDNIGDWLYIILLVIAGISGILSSGKKKRQTEERRQQDAEGDTPEYSDWETLPEVIPEALPTPQPINTHPKQKTTQVQSRHTIFKEGERAIAPLHSEQTMEKDSPESSIVISGEDFRNIDELKRAIIYSEILNRKY